jgi:acetyl esterase
MPLHPRIRELLDAEAAAGLPRLETLTPAAARAQTAAKLAAARIVTTEVARVEERRIPGPMGEIPVRVYAPPGLGPFPGIVHFHGGGFVICDLDTHDETCRLLCVAARAVVVAPDYRLAPEHRFPAATDDCLAATRWVAANAAALGIDPERLAVAGDSAGGNLATVTALRARDEGGPALAAQILFYPVTDHHEPGTPSYAACAEGYGLTRAEMVWFWDHYLADPSHARHPHAAPLRAPDLRGLPPAFVLSAEYDPLRDEAEDYARRLDEAGVPTALVRALGMHHGFLMLAGQLEEASLAIEETAAWFYQQVG